MKKKLRGELSIVIACAVFAGMSVLVKTASHAYSGLFISLIRFCIGLLLAWVAWVWWEKRATIQNKKAWILRGIFGAGAMASCYWAIQVTSSGRATLLSNTYPIFVAVFGRLFFKQAISWRQAIALLVCFSGVILVFYDHSQYPVWGNALALASGFFGGFAVHYMKQAREANGPFSVYLSACLFGVLLSMPAWHGLGTAPSPWLGLALLLVGVLGFVGQVMMTYGYKYVTATRGSILGFSETFFSIALSYWLTGEEMNLSFFLGAGLIVIGLLINQLRSSQIA